MKKLSNYIPYVLAGALFFTGRWTSPKPDKELMQKYEIDRKYHLSKIDSLKGKAANLVKVGEEIQEKMKSDSLEFAKALWVNKQAYLKLKKKYNEINISRASSHDLDSIISVLFPD